MYEPNSNLDRFFTGGLVVLIILIIVINVLMYLI